MILYQTARTSRFFLWVQEKAEKGKMLQPTSPKKIHFTKQNFLKHNLWELFTGDLT